MPPWDGIEPDENGRVVILRGRQDFRPGYCWCGCGELTQISTVTNIARGLVRGEPKRFASRGHGIRLGFKVRMEWFVRPNGCWEWSGAIGAQGYGRTSWRGGRESAHRVTLELATGIETPQGMHVDHLCRNRRCVNPAHLEVVTPAVNAARGVRPNLSEDEWLQFLDRASDFVANFAMLAAEYGVVPQAAFSRVLAAQRRESRRTNTNQKETV